MNTGNLLRNKRLWIVGGFILLIILISAIGGGEKKKEVGPAQISQPQSPKEQQIKSGEPKLIGKWYGLAEVYLAKNEETGQYAAVFQPPLEPTKQNMAQFAIGLIDEVWGRNTLVEGVLTPIRYEERFGTTLIYYETKDGGRIYFLVMKAPDTGGKIVGMSFWKEK